MTMNNNNDKENAGKELAVKESIEDRIKRITSEKADIYETEEDIEQREKDMARIEEGYKALSRKLALTEKNRWGYSLQGYMSKKLISKHLNSMKNGLTSVFPILCKQDGCPYSQSCLAYQNDMQPPYGEPCIVEVNKIENLLVGYASDFKIESSSTTDRVLIQELVQLDLLMDRCQCLMAQDGDILQDVTMGIDENGESYTQPVVSRYLDAWERLAKRRQSVLKEMLATRDSRKGMPQENTSEEDDLLRIYQNAPNFDQVEERPAQFREDN